MCVCHLEITQVPSAQIAKYLRRKKGPRRDETRRGERRNRMNLRVFLAILADELDLVRERRFGFGADIVEDVGVARLRQSRVDRGENLRSHGCDEGALLSGYERLGCRTDEDSNMQDELLGTSSVVCSSNVDLQ